MFTLGLPVIVQTPRPTIVGTPVFYAEATVGRTTLDMSITVAAGNSRKLVVIMGNNQRVQPTAVIFDPAGQALELTEADSGSNEDLTAEIWFLDTPPVGTFTVRITTATATWWAVSMKVIQEALVGIPACNIEGTDEGSEIEIGRDLILTDAYSLTVDLCLGELAVDGNLTPISAEQVVGADTVINPGGSPNNNFLAITSTRVHPNNGPVDHGWTSTVTGSPVLNAVANILFSTALAPPPPPPDEEEPEEFTAISSWTFDENGIDFEDEFGVATATVNVGTVVNGQAPLLADGGASIRVQSSQMRANASPEWQVTNWTCEVYFQRAALPALNEDWYICGKDSGLPSPGGFQLQLTNDGGVGRLNFYIRNAEGAAGSSIVIANDAGTIAANVGYRAVMTYHDATKTANLYLQAAGGSIALLATLTNALFVSLENNGSPFTFVSRGSTVGVEFDGFIDQVTFGSGVMTLAEIQARAAPLTITAAPAPGGITAVNDNAGSVPPNTTTDFDVLLNDTGLTGPHYQITITPGSFPVGRLSVINNNTANAEIRITTPAAPVNTVIEGGRYRVAQGTNPTFGTQSNEATLNWTRQGTSVETFPFVNVIRPAYQGRAVPTFDATDPQDAAVVDPMSDLEFFQILPHPPGRFGSNGRMIDVNGNNTIYYRQRFARHQSAPNDTSWNCDGTRLWFGHVPGDTMTTAGDWPGGGVFLRTSDWRITRFGGPGGPAFWHGDDPDLMWRWDTGCNWYLFNVVTGNETFSFNIPGYTASIGNQGNTTNPGRNNYCRKNAGPNLPGAGGPRYQALMARRTADNRLVIFRVRLDNGTKSGNIDLGPINNPFVFQGQQFGGAIPNQGTPRISANGQYLLVTYGGDNYWCFNVPAAGDNSLASQFVSSIINGQAGNFGGLRHPDFLQVNGRQIAVGVGGGDPTPMVYWDLGNGDKRAFANIPNAGNPNTTSTQGRFDLFETYGAAGGATTGRRYAIFGKSGTQTAGGMWAFRTGPNDTNQVRYIGHPRGEANNNDNLQCDPVIDPTGRYILWVTSWSLQGAPGIGTATPYITILTPGWYNPNNDGE